jgi:hypothetical protein
LARLKGGRLFSGGVFEIHSKPHGPDDKSNNSCGNVLSDLPALFICKLSGFGVVGFDFGSDHRAVRELILRLHRRNRLRIATGARS